MKALVAGWFSFEEMGATAGDFLAKDVVCAWLGHAGCTYDVALAPPFSGGIDWRVVNPQDYSHVVFVCGPFGNGWPITDFLPRFASSTVIGVDLSMLESLEVWNPFHLLLERDSSRASRPDLSFLSQAKLVPVAGLVLIHPQPEYRERDRHEGANEALRRLVASRDLASVSIDTRLDVNNTGLRTPAEVETLIARMDVVLTTRLHGLVLAIKNGVPAVAVDPVAGGAKIRRQAEAIGWPVVFGAESLSHERLCDALDYCLTARARTKAAECSARAQQALSGLEAQFVSAIVGAR